jgi:nucleoporin p58/p45
MAGSLTMGQGNPQTNNTQPGVKIDMSNLRPTTRFSDLHDDLKKQIESIDAFIRQQESFATQCEGMIGRHATDVESIKPDVDLIQNKIETVELALENDGAAIENAKELVQRDAGDLIRVARMAENLQLPQQYHYGRSSRPSTTDDEYDIDLVGYFGKQAEVMQQTLDTYTSHLAEIEAHLRVVEGSTVQQAHQIAAQRSGGRAGNSADNVRELAETLRGFESGILGAAGLVGSCREGVNELILGKIGNDPRESVGYGGRRSVRF